MESMKIEVKIIYGEIRNSWQINVPKVVLFNLGGVWSTDSP